MHVVAVAARLVVANRFFCYDFVITMDFQRHCYIGGGQLSSWKYTQFGNPDSGVSILLTNTDFFPEIMICPHLRSRFKN